MRFLRDGIFFTLLFFSTGVGSDYNYNDTYDKHDDDKILSRKRRFLNFPEGSTFVMTLSNTKGLVWDIPLFMPPWNNIMEFDLIFKLTNVTKLFLSKKASHLHRQERSNFYRQLEDFLDIFDFNGRACIFKTLCEAREVLRPGMSFMEDLMHVLFRPTKFQRGNCGWMETRGLRDLEFRMSILSPSSYNEFRYCLKFYVCHAGY